MGRAVPVLAALAAATLFAAVGALVVLAHARPAEATFPGQDGKIVYSAWDDGQKLFTIDPDGSGQTKIYTSPRYDSDPAWSPDGTKIAFVGDMNGNTDIYVIDADGSGLKRITTSQAADLAPSWSPNGKWIAFHRSDRGIYKIRVDRTGLKRLSGDMRRALQPAWSPSGKKIAFSGSRGRGAWDIFKMDATDGRNKRALTDTTVSEFDPNWSPDGKRIAYTWHYPGESGGFDLTTMNADGTDQTALGPRGSEPTWSPDGTKIAYIDRGRQRIRNMNADGTGDETLITADDIDALDWQPLHQ